MMIKTGIYQIENITNGHKYIGSAVNIRLRWKNHLQSLRAGIHHSGYLQRAFILYGEDSFSFTVLCECAKEALISEEQKYIDAIRPEYNICRIAGSPLGVKHTDETKTKVSRALIGNQYAFGRKHTDEWKQANAARMVGNKHSLGTKQSEETKEKKRAACKGKHVGSQPWLGRTHTEETKEKMSIAQKGIPKTEEAKQHMREARQRYFERKRAAVETTL